MHPTITPNSSPLSSRSSKPSVFRHLYSPEHPSPLDASARRSSLTFSPISNVGARLEHRKRQYKSQSSSRNDHSSPVGQLLRDRFKAHCLERARQTRRGVLKRNRSLDHEFSSDGFDMDGDCDMDEDVEGDEDIIFQDELYRRVMMNEIRKSKHALNVSFEREFGSSIDPNMYEDMSALESGFTGQEASKTIENVSSLSEIENDDALIAEYLAELEESELQAMQERVTCGMVDINTEDPSDLEKQFAPPLIEQPSPSRSMYSEFALSSPPSSPVFHILRMEENDISTCSFCHSPRPYDQVACANCVRTRSLEYAQTAWTDPDMHSTPLNRLHTPLVAETPTGCGVGAMMLCGAEGCDWCFAL